MINECIKECKDFWKITNFQEEILNWRFYTQHPKNKKFTIGHPIGSHKGPSIGDILPYTRLPELIKREYPNISYVSVPPHFRSLFQENPYVDDFKGVPERWGSLGTWGNTVQRTCNVWGLHTFETDPIVYHSEIKHNTIIFSVNSNTGGKLEEFQILEDIVEELKTDYYCIQIGLGSDHLLKNVNEYMLNLDIKTLIKEIASAGIYIGVQNSLYHLAKAVGLNVIGILPKQLDPRLVVLPLLTQVNYNELEMLPESQKTRAKVWSDYIRMQGIDPDSSAFLGWLYPDIPHLTENKKGTERCPTVSVKNIKLALNDEIYPYKDHRLWDFKINKDLWI